MKAMFVQLFVLTLSVTVVAEASQPKTLGVRVAAVNGSVEAGGPAGEWVPVAAGTLLTQGMKLRTGPGASADLLLEYNGSAFRLTSEGEINIRKLECIDTGLGMVTDTRLHVARGELVGSQRKLHRPSVLEITSPQGEAIIRGTEYVVNAEGAVSVLSGSVQVRYNLPGNKGSIVADVSPGYTFNPATGTVVQTTSGFLQNIIADVNAVRENAEVYKASGATIVVKPNTAVSPTNPKGNNGVGNGIDPQPPGNPPVNDGPGTSPGNPGNQGGSKK